MDEYFKYVKSNNTYLIKKKYLKLKLNQKDIDIINQIGCQIGGQIGGSLNHKLFNKIMKSKDKNKAIKKEKEKLIKAMAKIVESKKVLNKEGYTSYQYFLLASQLTTLWEIEEDPNFNYDKVVNAGELYAKLYIQFLLKKYKKDINLVKSILKKELPKFGF
jgi:hypothetical protein